MIYDDWTVKQNMNCDDRLTPKTGPDDKVIPFGTVPDAWIKIADDYEEFFTHLSQTECPVTNCEVSNISECGTPLTSINVRSGGAIGEVVVNPTNLDGFTENLCISCYIGTHRFDWTGTDPAVGWKITQEKKVCTDLSLDLSAALSKNVITLVPGDSEETELLGEISSILNH